MRPAFFILGVLVLLAACDSQPASETAVRPALVQMVQPAPVKRAATYAGAVHARHATVLSFRIGGKVVQRMVGLGDHVQAGQLLARLDGSQEQLSVAAARASLDAAEQKHALAKTQYDRAAYLLQRDAISQSRYDQRKSELQVAAAQLERAHKRYAMQQNQLDHAQLRADHAGVITQVHVQAGQVVAAGQPVFGFARDGAREFWVAVPESRIDTVRKGDTARIGFWALPGVQVPGRVREVAADADPRSHTYLVRITLLKQPPGLHLGMSGLAGLRDKSTGQVIRLPLTSLYHIDDQSAVWVVDPATGRVGLQTVGILRYENDAAVLATGQGLQAGDVVVVKGVGKLHVGQQVKPVKAADDQDATPQPVY